MAIVWPPPPHHPGSPVQWRLLEFKESELSWAERLRPCPTQTVPMGRGQGWTAGKGRGQLLPASSLIGAGGAWSFFRSPGPATLPRPLVGSEQLGEGSLPVLNKAGPTQLLPVVHACWTTLMITTWKGLRMDVEVKVSQPHHFPKLVISQV